MRSKRERFLDAAERLNAVRCRCCGGKMTWRGDCFACEAGHTQDVNRKGYVNCLTRPHPTYYDQALFDARRQVFGAGCYAEVCAAIETLLPQGTHRLLDAGCGEGYYLNTLLSAHPDWQGAGVDISREAIERATDWPCEALWCVADLGSLPFLDDSFTAVLDVLTPANYREFSRVLAPGGRLVKVYPGTHYLQEIRQTRGMSLYEDTEVGDYLNAHCRVTGEKHIRTACAVTPELWRAFVWMTPLNQDLSAKEKDALAARPADTVTIDLHVVCGELQP